MTNDSKLKVETMKVADLVPYAMNARQHTEQQVDQIAASIAEFGMNDPIAVWHNKNGQPIIVEGHGRLLALEKLGVKECPVIMLDHLTDAQRKAYTLIHNQLTLNSSWDLDKLNTELESLADDFDLDFYGFNLPDKDFNPDDFFNDAPKDDQWDKDKKSKTCKCPKCGYEFEL